MSKPLLSICIPTKNHIGELSIALDSIVSSSVFLETNKIEILISDNNSDDDTEAVIRSYCNQYGDKIKYIKHKVDVHPHLNFEISLLSASGIMRKLHNSYFSFAPGAVDMLVDLVENFSIKKPVIFLANGADNVQQEDLFLCNGIDEFIRKVSFWNTWIGGFFVWEDDLNTVGDFNREINSLLSHTEFLMRVIDKKNLVIVVNKKMMKSHRTWPRGGYNVAEVFGKNYLGIIGEYVKNNKLSKRAFQDEKRKVLLEHILPNYFSSFHDFGSHDILKYLSDYERDEYFYMAMISGMRQKGNVVQG